MTEPFSTFFLMLPCVEMSKKITYNFRSKEVDVYCEDTECRYIIECKSWSNFRNKKTEIEKWIDDKYQFLIDWNDERNRNEGKKELKNYFIISLRDIDIGAVNKQFKQYSVITFHNRTFLEKFAKNYRRRDIRLALQDFSNE